jgi:hypothetical protein
MEERRRNAKEQLGYEFKFYIEGWILRLSCFLYALVPLEMHRDIYNQVEEELTFSS